ncbi:IS982 family transposase [Micropruina sp.]|uniref:IS982 family transposase n=1 Tax=Micropruina sp. TaxID=2737536 RepID=UPI0039E708EB
MDTDLDTLAIALYVTADDLLKAHPEQVPQRPEVGFVERISDAELIVLAVMQAFLGYTSEARWLRYAHRHLRPMFPYLPRQSGYNKRLRKLNGTMAWLAAELARHVPVASDDVWVVDSTPVECGRSRETAKRSDLAGWAEYGYCASHSRYFWGLRLHLVCTLHGLPLAWALTGAKANERDVVEHLLDSTAALQDRPTRRRQIIIADKGYSGREFETGLTEVGIDLLRPARKGEKPRPGQRFFKPLRQIIESVNDTLKGQLDLEAHGGRTPAGVAARVAQRILALTTAIWHNHQANSLARRNLVAYDH